MPETTASDAAIKAEILDFGDKWLTECQPLPDITQTDSTEFLKELAMSDSVAYECYDRHNGLVKQIKEKQELIKKQLAE